MHTGIYIYIYIYIHIHICVGHIHVSYMYTCIYLYMFLFLSLYIYIICLCLHLIPTFIEWNPAHDARMHAQTDYHLFKVPQEIGHCLRGPAIFRSEKCPSAVPFCVAITIGHILPCNIRTLTPFPPAPAIINNDLARSVMWCLSQ